MNDHYVTAAQLIELEMRLAGFVKHSLQAATDAALRTAVLAHTPEIIEQPLAPAPEPEPTVQDLKARVEALLIENKHLLSENSRLTGLAWDAEQKVITLEKVNAELKTVNAQLGEERAKLVKGQTQLLDELHEEHAAREAATKMSDRLARDLTATLKRHGFLVDLCGND